jgi:hypothetical protein
MENKELLIEDSDYTVVWGSDFDGRLQITLEDRVFDRNKIYTIDYFASPKAKDIDVLSRFNSKRLPKPESYNDTDSDNKIVTQYFPFINYGIINSLDFELQEDINSYRYTAPTGQYATGLAEIHPNWVSNDGTFIPISGHVDVFAVTGVTGVADSNWGELISTYLSDPYRYYLKIDDLAGEIYELNRIIDDQQFSITEIPVLQTGFIGNEIDDSWVIGNILEYTGEGSVSTLTGYLQIPYSIHVVYKDGDEIFGFDNLDYTPIDVSVGGTKARNITNYVDLEQPAFTVSDSIDNEFEFIHDGKNIYFNRPAKSTEIQVDYKWMTKYVKVNCVLRANKIVNPTVTPQINEYRLLLNTTIL